MKTKLTLEQIKIQCDEMWSAVNDTPYGNSDRNSAFEEARETERRLLSEYYQNESILFGEKSITINDLITKLERICPELKGENKTNLFLHKDIIDWYRELTNLIKIEKDLLIGIKFNHCSSKTRIYKITEIIGDQYLIEWDNNGKAKYSITSVQKYVESGVWKKID